MDRYDSTCWSVVLGAAAGEPGDREAFSRVYGPVIKSYLAARWRVPYDDADVDDAMQEAFIQIFKPGGALEHVDPQREGGFRAFLYGLVRNVALMAERSERRRRQRVQTESVFTPDEVADSEATLSQAREAKERMIRRLRSGGSSRDQARILDLRYAEGLPPREIASRLGIEVTVVYEALRTAKDAYRTALLEVLAGHHPGATRPELEKICAELGGLL